MKDLDTCTCKHLLEYRYTGKGCEEEFKNVKYKHFAESKIKVLSNLAQSPKSYISHIEQLTFYFSLRVLKNQNCCFLNAFYKFCKSYTCIYFR